MAIGVTCAAPLATAVYTVGPGEAAVVSRFGRLVRVNETAGAHAKLPWPFESVEWYSVGAVDRLELGFRTVAEGTRPSERPPEPQAWDGAPQDRRREFDQALMVTGDESIVDLSVVVHFAIRDLRSVITGFDAPVSTLRNALESVLSTAVGRVVIDEVLVGDRAALRAAVAAETQRLADAYGLGLVILAVDFIDVAPPVETVNAFRDVASAKELKDAAIHDAVAYGNRIVPEARGGAARQTAAAAAAGLGRKLTAQGRAARLAALASAYRDRPEIAGRIARWEAFERSHRGQAVVLVESGLSERIELVQGAAMGPEPGAAGGRGPQSGETAAKPAGAATSTEVHR